uniref:Uncharacterized protein n=1 Tax=Anguilla anguilla TaxID=7936 RepID=A0A0E9VJM6_ANGAN
MLLNSICLSVFKFKGFGERKSVTS